MNICVMTLQIEASHFTKKQQHSIRNMIMSKLSIINEYYDDHHLSSSDLPRI